MRRIRKKKKEREKKTRKKKKKKEKRTLTYICNSRPVHALRTCVSDVSA